MLNEEKNYVITCLENKNVEVLEITVITRGGVELARLNHRFVLSKGDELSYPKEGVKISLPDWCKKIINAHWSK